MGSYDEHGVYTWSEEDLAAARATFPDYEHSDRVIENLKHMPPLSEEQLARLAVIMRRIPET